MNFLTLTVFLLMLASAPLRAAPALRYSPDFGIPGLSVTLQGKDVGTPGLMAEINGLPAPVQTDLPDLPKGPDYAYIQIPATAHSGPLTVHRAGDPPRFLGNLLVTPVVIGHLQVPAGMNPKAYAVLSPFGQSTVDATGEFRIPVLKKGITRLTAVSPEPGTLLQGMTFDADHAPVISALTSAASLTLLHPLLMTSQLATASVEWAAALGRPEVADLGYLIEAALLQGGDDPLDTDAGQQKFADAANAVLAVLPPNPSMLAKPVKRGARPLGLPVGPIYGEPLQGLSLKLVTKYTKDDKLPIPRVEFEIDNVLARTHLLVDMKELDVKPGDLKARGKGAVYDEAFLAPTFDKTAKREMGTVFLPFTPVTSNVDVVREGVKKLEGLIWEDKRYLPLPNDHPGAYLIRVYGGLGALPFAPFTADRKLAASIPNGKARLAEVIIADVLDMALDIIRALPLGEGKDALLGKNVKAAENSQGELEETLGSSMFVMPDRYALKQQIFTGSSAIAADLAKQVDLILSGDTVDPQQVFNLIIDVTFKLAQQIITNYIQHKYLDTISRFATNGGTAWFWGSYEPTGAAKESYQNAINRMRAAEDEFKVMSQLKSIWSKVNLLAKAGAAGSAVERLVGIIGADPLETALVYVGDPLAPQNIAIDPSAPRAGGKVTITGDFLNMATYQTSVDVRVPGATSGVPAPDLLPVLTSPGQQEKLTFTLPDDMQGIREIHIETNQGTYKSYPFRVVEKPVISSLFPNEAPTGSIVTVFGKNLFSPVTITVGTSTTPASVDTQMDGDQVTFQVPADANTGSIKLTSGDFPTVLSKQKLTIIPRPSDPPQFPNQASVTFNSRARSPNGGSRFITFDEAIALATGKLSKSSLAKRPLDEHGNILDDTCNPYAAELVSGNPGPDALVTISLYEEHNYCDPDEPRRYAVPPDSIHDPFTFDGDLELPPHVILGFPVDLTFENGNLILKDDDSVYGAKSITVNHGSVILQGDRVHLTKAKVTNAPGNAVIFSGGRFAMVDGLEIESPAGDGVTFEEPDFQGGGTTAHPATGNQVSHLSVTGSKRNGIRLGENSSGNTLNDVTIHGNSGGPAIYLAPGASGNTVDLREVSANTGGPGILFQDAPANRIQPHMGDDGIYSGYLYGLPDDAIQMAGAGSFGNNVGDLHVGVGPQGGSAATGNTTGIDVKGGANHNNLSVKEVAYSKGDGIVIEGAGSDENLISGVHLYSNTGSGAALKDGAAFNRIQNVWAYGNHFGMQISGGVSNMLDTDALYQNVNGLSLDKGAVDNQIRLNGIFSNTGDGMTMADANTAGNTIWQSVVGAAPSGWENWLPPGTPFNGNGGNGVKIMNGALDNYVGPIPPERDGNSIINNALAGIRITGAGTEGNHVTANTVGYDGGVTGRVPQPNGTDGVLIDGGATDNVLGWNYEWNAVYGQGFTEALSPVLWNNKHAGAFITGPDTTDNRVVSASMAFSPVGLLLSDGAHDNQIGTYFPNRLFGTGNERPPTVNAGSNAVAGIESDGPGNVLVNLSVGDPIQFSNSPPNGVGILVGADASNTEVFLADVFGSKTDGIRFLSDFNWVDQSVIGPPSAASATFEPPNGVGIHIMGAGNVVGSPWLSGFDLTSHGAKQSNRISGNTAAGVMIEGKNASDNQVVSNVIGGDNGLGPNPNHDGVLILNAPSNTVGGPFGGFVQNYLLGSTNAGVRVEGSDAAENNIGDNTIGSKNAPNGIGVQVKDADHTNIGGDPDDSENLDGFANQIYFNTVDGVQVDESRLDSTAVLSNSGGSTSGKLLDILNGPASPGFTLTPTSATSLTVNLDPDRWPEGGLLQLFLANVPGNSSGGSSPPPDNTVFYTEVKLNGPGETRVFDLPFAFQASQPGVKLIATITDPTTGGTSSFSSAAAPNTTFLTDASLDITVVSAPVERAVQTGQKGVEALALDFHANGNVRVNGLKFQASGWGNEAAAIDRIRVGIAQPNTLELDPNRPLLLDTPGFARDDGTLDLQRLALSLTTGESVRLLVLYDFTASAPEGSYTLSLPDAASVTAATEETQSTASVSGTFPFYGTQNRIGTLIPGDLDGNGIVDARDMNIEILIFLGTRQPTPRELAAGDLRPKPGLKGQPYGDGKIGADDINELFRIFRKLETSP